MDLDKSGASIVQITQAIRKTLFGFAFSFILLTVGIDNRAHHFTNAPLEILAAARVMEFNAFALTTDKLGFGKILNFLEIVDFEAAWNRVTSRRCHNISKRHHFGKCR